MLRLQDKPVLLCSILLFIFVPAVIGIGKIQIKQDRNEQQLSFTIEIEHFGVDAREIERSITIPLEDAITELSGTKSITSMSEMDRSRIQVITAEHVTFKEYYIGLRDVVDRVHAGLPRSVQKPRIYTGSHDAQAIFIVMLTGKSPETLRTFAEKKLEPQLQKIPGAGATEVGGGRQEEIQIFLDPLSITSHKLTSANIMQILQQQHILLPLGELNDGFRKTPVVWDSRLKIPEAFAELQIPLPESQSQKLGSMAKVNRGYRNPDIISRVSGQEQVVIAVKDAGFGDLSAVSAGIRKVLQSEVPDTIQYKILLDLGRDLSNSFFAILRAIGISMFITLLFAFFVLRDLRSAILISLTLPFHVVLCIGWPSLFGMSFSLNALAGIGMAIGSVADSAIILVFVRTRNNSSLGEQNSIHSSLLASMMTSIIVILPLVIGPFYSAIGSMATIYAIILMGSTVLNLLFIPSIFELTNKKLLIGNKLRPLGYGFFRIIRTATNWRKRSLGISLFLTVSVIAAFVFYPRGESPFFREASFNVHAEFPPGSPSSVVDQGIHLLSDQFQGLPGVISVDTTARRENGSLLIHFDPKTTNDVKLKRDVEAWNKRVSDIFLFPENMDSGQQVGVTLQVIGPEAAILHELTQKIGSLAANDPNIKSVVFHFKEGASSYILHLDNQKLKVWNLSARTVSDEIRAMIEGPVALKWQDAETELDIRIFNGALRPHSIESILDSRISGTQGLSVPVRAVATVETSPVETRTINRFQRERGLELEIITKFAEPEKAIRWMNQFVARQPLPTGYAIVPDKEIVLQAERSRSLTFMIAIATFLVLSILIFQYESFKSPILVIISILPSLFLPLLAIIIRGSILDSRTLISMIIVCGIVANNAILIVSDYSPPKNSPMSKAKTMTRIIFARLPPLSLTTGATMLSTLPFLVFPDFNAAFLSELSLTVFLGSAGSFMYTIFVFPGLLEYLRPKMNFKHIVLKDR